MRIQVDTHQDLKAVPRSLYRGERRIDIIEVIDQWYGAGYRYVKVRGHDGSVYILHWDEICDQWEMIMFSAERSTGRATRAPCSLPSRANAQAYDERARQQLRALSMRLTQLS